MRARTWSVAAITACLAAGAVAGCVSSEPADGGSAGTATGGAIANGGGVSAGAGAGGVPGAGSASGGSPAGGASFAAGAPGNNAGSNNAGSNNAGSNSAGSNNAGSNNAGNNNAGGSAGGGGAAGGSAGGGGGAAGADSTCPTAKPLTGGKKYCSNSTGNAAGNYTYELWAEGNGSGCMNVYGTDAAFNANWSNVEDFLARIGLTFDRTKTPAKIGTISAEFAETKTGGTDGLVYVGIYGWTVDPLREYYILEDWGSTKPAGVASDGTPRDNMGTITVDGAVYDVWKKTRTNKPAITGDNKTFDQYFSIRRSARQCGHVSISEHFSKWIGLGLQLGNLVEAKWLLEAQDSSGTIDFTSATVVVK